MPFDDNRYSLLRVVCIRLTVLVETVEVEDGVVLLAVLVEALVPLLHGDARVLRPGVAEMVQLLRHRLVLVPVEAMALRDGQVRVLLLILLIHSSIRPVVMEP